MTKFMVHLNKSHYNFDWTDTEKRIAEEKRYLEMKSFCLNYNPKVVIVLEKLLNSRC
jgi:hypothetical protein